MSAVSLNDILTVLARYSNTFSIGFIVICCVSMVVFIMRLSTEHFQSSVDITPGSFVPAQAMTGAYNPFVLSIQENSSSSSINDGISVKLTSQVPFILQDFWGVEIKDVYQRIFQSWAKFEEQFSHNTLFEDITQMKNEQRLFNHSCHALEQNLKPPIDSSRHIDMGPVPRDRYPLVVTMVANDAQISENSIVSMVSIIHVKDEVVTVPSHIITQYVRTAHSQPVCLQQLYVASADESSMDKAEPADSASSDETKTADYCVICQTDAISRVILPCRHACVCDACFLRLEKCPMCRGPIYSFFMLHGSTVPPPEDNRNQTGTAGAEHENWWFRLNNSINDFFGFAS